MNPIPSQALEQLYTQRVTSVLRTKRTEKETSEMVDDVEKSDDKLLLQMSDAKQLATVLDAPELALEAERAIVQVEQHLTAQQQSTQGKEDSTSPKKEN